MKSFKNNSQLWVCQKGFSLIELMVSLVIVSIIIISLAAVFERSGKLYTTQNVGAGLQDEVRAAVEIMAREIRMAGYDPYKTGDFQMPPN